VNQVMTVSSEQIPTTESAERLKRTADYRAMRGARRHHARAFILQARKRPDAAGASDKPRFGLTVTKKTGNAVERNRIRRRLREAIRAGAPGHALARFDYVLIAKREALSEPFAAIVAQLAEALDRTGRLGANPRQPKSGSVRIRENGNRRVNGGEAAGA